ncbi:hypothetical protein QRX50_36645 [Amycolatopsis carbonis]|uniref:Uncharacterized protein n=1 Tax=Amycolatopsis carbonis TaxID=715471 RepID=A0A9Y2IS27_9PSEU|nr:hypothetical protein [Amycolatopsis sp. 2-15]WIX84126.1 hypothetical protein QRX50_36645 [Amycolatopsis sp. 2-15]
MALHRITADAFERLTEQSQHPNFKLHAS